ncbi:TPA: HAD family hydrolase [Bacillus cereus]|uniref:HAD family hydrolase n=1 Tax=Bacillus cereus group TaxID=86661 RepID=UPI0000E89F80|nr:MULTISPECIES: HAD family hydrolase [Bacillus cereus group]ABK87557.1 haloacid dehalogenase-like hydrolase [Bacillus thuringiensis str. Al Hakam]AEW57922.1 2-haloalkanoic acid dehalogenase [Bacillus cereus F837/76]AJH70255.1 HAD hydrolase, IA, variant 1 family protein [Bacillus thuringiensis]KXY88279.1 HAD family hydrolase [Bacillus cereus]MDA2018433.1 HAD family hydrolase [Bacillus cereus]
MIRAVLFDLDGTLLDRRQSLEQFIYDQYNRFASYLINIEKSEYCSRFLALDNNGYTWKDKVYATLLSEYNITTLTSEQLLHDYITNFQHHCIPFQNMHELLQRLTQQNMKIGIITNGFTDFQMNNLRALNIHTYTNMILVSEAEGIKKPHPEIFERALKKLDVKAEECLYVGDHPENDVLGSEQVGILGVWKRDSFRGDFEHSRVVDDLLEVLSFLEVETKTKK